MYTFQNALKAALYFAGKNDIRFYLNGVYCVDGTIQSTDGHRAIMIKANYPEWAEGKIFDRDSVAKIIKIKKQDGINDGLYVDDEPMLDFAERHGIYPRFLQGKFPQISRIIPTNETPKNEYLCKLNMKYYMDAVNALIALDDPQLMSKRQPREIDFKRYGDHEKCHFATEKVDIVIMTMRI